MLLNSKYGLYVLAKYNQEVYYAHYKLKVTTFFNFGIQWYKKVSIVIIKVRFAVAWGRNVSITIFLLGRPGSGKSTAARHIDMLARDRQWSSCHINDYTFLLKMFQDDSLKPEKERRFASTKLGGFDVIDFSVLDEALRGVEQAALEEQQNENKVLLLEFARGDYREVFEQFNPLFLRNAYFLFFEVNVDICVTRVNERALYPASEDDHFISEKMLKSYYSTENKAYMQEVFALEYGIDPFRVKVVDNMGDWKEFGNQLKDFLHAIWLNEAQRTKAPEPLIILPAVGVTSPHNTEPLDPAVVEKIDFPRARALAKTG